MQNWDLYLKLMKERPTLFAAEKSLDIILDEEEIRKFEAASDREIGVVYQSPYHYLLVDLVRGKNGILFPHERVIPVRTGAVAILPMYDGKIVLIRQFRHSARQWCWEIPRGFGENGASTLANAKRELQQETGIERADFRYVGHLMPDSGIIADHVNLFIAEVQELNCSTIGQEDTEDIAAVRVFSMEEIKEMILRGELTDSFTLSALAAYQLLA